MPSDDQRDPWPDPMQEPVEPVNPNHPRFVIACVGWLTQRPGMQGTEEETRTIYRTLILFLQENGLTTREILSSDEPVTDSVAIRNEDLTPEGNLLMRRPHSRWLDGIDCGKSPTDVSSLKRALERIRSGKVGEYGE